MLAIQYHSAKWRVPLILLQVTVNVSGEQIDNNFDNPLYHTKQQAVEVKSIPVNTATTQVRWDQTLTTVYYTIAFFLRKLAAVNG